MPRSTTAYSSAYQLDRVHESQFVTLWTGTLTTNFVGVLRPGEVIASATWYNSNPYVIVLTEPNGSNTTATVHAVANYPGFTSLKCEVTLTNGDIRNQLWVCEVKDIPGVGAGYQSAGTSSLTWTNDDAEEPDPEPNPDAGIAIGLLAKLTEWWTFDNTLNGSIGGAATAFVPNAAGPTYAASTKSFDAKPQTFIQVGNIAGSAAESRSYWCILDLNGGRTGVNTGYNTQVGFKPHGFGNGLLRDWFGSYEDGSVISAYITDNTPYGVHYNTLAAGPHLVCVNVDRSAVGTSSDVELFVNGVSLGSSGPRATFEDAGTLVIVNSGAPTNCIDGIDELGYIGGALLTQEEITYLYNGGAFKSYAEVVADSLL